MLDELSLHRVQPVGLRQALDSRHPGSRGGDRQSKARIDTPAVDQHRAGAALPVVATLFGAGELQVLAQRIEERDARVEAELMIAAVDLEANRNGRCTVIRPRGVHGRANRATSRIGFTQ